MNINIIFFIIFKLKLYYRIIWICNIMTSEHKIDLSIFNIHKIVTILTIFINISLIYQNIFIFKNLNI